MSFRAKRGNPSVYASLRRDLGLIRVQPERLTYNKDEKPDTPGSLRSLSLPQDDNGLCIMLLFIITNLSAYVIPSEAWESRLIRVQPERLTYNKDKKPDTPGSSRSLSLPQDDIGGVFLLLLYIQICDFFTR